MGVWPNLYLTLRVSPVTSCGSSPSTGLSLAHGPTEQQVFLGDMLAKSVTIILDLSARARAAALLLNSGGASVSAAPLLYVAHLCRLWLGTGQLELQDRTKDVVRQIDQAVRVEIK